MERTRWLHCTLHGSCDSTQCFPLRWHRSNPLYERISRKKTAGIWIFSDRKHVAFTCGDKLDVNRLSAGLSVVEVERSDILWHCQLYVNENADRCCRHPGFTMGSLLSHQVFKCSTPLKSYTVYNFSGIFQSARFMWLVLFLVSVPLKNRNNSKSNNLTHIIFRTTPNNAS